MARKLVDIAGLELVDKKQREKEKVTWDMIYDDFDMRHPNSKNHVIHKIPAGIGMLRVFMDDGRVLLYYYDTHSTVPDYSYMEKRECEQIKYEGNGDNE